MYDRIKAHGRHSGIAGSGKPGIVQVSVLFSVVIFLFIFIGYRVQGKSFYPGVLITEFGLIMLPALIFLILFKYDLKTVLRLKGTKPLNFFVTFFLMLFAIPLAGVFNLLNLLIVNSIFGKIIINQPPTATNAKELLVNILVIAGSAGLCEEFLFRGVIQRGFERFSATRAILLAAFLFSLTHLDFQKIFGTFLLGALIGLIVYRTDSLFCGMFAHFTNNAVVVLLSYISVKLTSIFKGSGMQMPEGADLNGLISTFGKMPPQQLTVVLYVYGFLFLFLITIFLLLLFAFLKLNLPEDLGKAGFTIAKPDPSYALLDQHALTDKKPDPTYTSPDANLQNLPSDATTTAVKAKESAKGLLWLLPGVLLITGIYYIEVLKFNGAGNAFIETVRHILGVH